MITGRQAKAAREMLGWTRTKLAYMAHVAQSTVSNLEAKGRLSPLLALAVHNTLEAAGVEFVNGGEPSVRFKAKAAVAKLTK
jgi:DNA-binding XRE family transcriptional regulator